MIKVTKYTPNDYLSPTELKSMPIGTLITGEDTCAFALKTDYDCWSFNDRIDTFSDWSSRQIASAFEDTSFTISTPD